MRTDPEKLDAEAEAQARSYNRHARRGAAATGKDPQDILDEDDGPQGPLGAEDPYARRPVDDLGDDHGSVDDPGAGRSARGPPADPNDVFLSARKTWERYSVSSMSLHRWLKDPRMGFPRPTYIQKRRYFRLSQLVAWERARAGRREVV